MKYTSKVNYANKNNTTLKAVIPSEIAEALNLSANDTLKWTIKENNIIKNTILFYQILNHSIKKQVDKINIALANDNNRAFCLQPI